MDPQASPFKAKKKPEKQISDDSDISDSSEEKQASPMKKKSSFDLSKMNPLTQLQSSDLDLDTYIGNSYNFIMLIHHALSKHTKNYYECEGNDLKSIVNKWEFKNFEMSPHL